MLSTRTRWILLAALVVHLVAAWFSTGFQSADEHYQVIAFAEARLGHQPVSGLPWEYAAHIRSALLPSACLVIFKMAAMVGVTSPFVLAFLLRLITALAALLAVYTFVKAVRHRVPENLWTPFLLLSFFLWFLPFLHVRFTGETWSGLFVLLALAALLSGEDRAGRHLRCGLWLGLAFLCRPPTLAMALGIVLWLAVVKREHLQSILQFLIGIAVMVLAGIALDSWYYNEPTITAWNYFHQGIAGNGDHRFLPYAWWYYPAWVVKYTIPPFGLAILAAFATLLAFRPKHILVWVTVPFLVLHLALAHKDLRFLHPLADLLPLMLIQAWAVWRERKVWSAVPAGVLKPLLAIVIVINSAALVAVILAPAGSGRTHLAALVRSHYPGEVVRLNYVAGHTTVWDIRIPRFYLPPTVSDTLIDAPCNLMSPSPGTIELLVTDQPTPNCESMDGQHWSEVGSALPRWKQLALEWYAWEDAKPVWKLYESRPQGTSRLPSAP